MMGGLQTFANLDNRVAATFALAPIDWGLNAAGPFGPVVHYEDGVLMTVTRRDGQVSMTAITEAGAAIVAELDRNDAMTLAALCTVEGA